MLHDFRYAAPESRKQLLSLVSEHQGKAKVLAGGTDLLTGIRAGSVKPEVVIDLKRLAEIAPFWNRYTAFMARDEQPAHDPAALADYRWMVEEFRISLFAQELGTVAPASAKRLDAQWQRVLAT